MKIWNLFIGALVGITVTSYYYEQMQDLTTECRYDAPAVLSKDVCSSRLDPKLLDSYKATLTKLKKSRPEDLEKALNEIIMTKNWFHRVKNTITLKLPISRFDYVFLYAVQDLGLMNPALIEFLASTPNIHFQKFAALNPATSTKELTEMSKGATRCLTYAHSVISHKNTPQTEIEKMVRRAWLASDASLTHSRLTPSFKGEWTNHVQTVTRHLELADRQIITMKPDIEKPLDLLNISFASGSPNYPDLNKNRIRDDLDPLLAKINAQQPLGRTLYSRFVVLNHFAMDLKNLAKAAEAYHQIEVTRSCLYQLPYRHQEIQQNLNELFVNLINTPERRTAWQSYNLKVGGKHSGKIVTPADCPNTY